MKRFTTFTSALVLAFILPTAAQTGVTFEQLKSFGKPSPGGNPRAGLMQGTDGALYGTALGGSSGHGVVFKLNPDGTGYTVLKNFDYSTSGANPSGKLMQGTDGALYGTASEGGSSGYGVVFKLNPDGTGFTVLKNFDYSTTGGYLDAGLLQGTDGALYGTAYEGGSSGYGVVFKLNPDRDGFTILKNFDYSTTGGYLDAGLQQGMDGALYGMGREGGSSGYGVVFKLNPDRTDFTVLKNFDYFTTGGYLDAGLLQGAEGALYGTASQGGSSDYGTAFKLSPDGTGFTVLKNFDYSTTGGYLDAGLLQGADGALYGTASQGGSSGGGTVFKLSPDGTGFTVLKNFDYSTTGRYPSDALVQGADGALYGTVFEGGSSFGGTVFKLKTDGSDFTVLKNLSYGADITEEGGYLYSSVIQATDGALYGTTSQGGSAGYGTVFKMNTDGSGFTVTKNFDLYTTGGTLLAGLMQGTDGALYGTAYRGGSSGAGTVWRLNTDGSGFTVLKNFDYSTSGFGLYSSVIQASDGALYGTTRQGGSRGYGTVFKLNTDGSGFTVQKHFDYSTTGGYLYSGVMIQGTDVTLYGTASMGGSRGYGTVFKLNTDGTGFTVLKGDFDYSTTGGNLHSGLMQGADGALYGTASQGGSSGYGTVWKLNTDGSGFSVLQNFDYSTTGGSSQGGGLVQRADGTIYGTAYQGGSSGAGTVFQLNPDGSDFSVFLNFDNAANGGYPFGGLTKGTDGNLYGTTSQGGNGAGTVFRLIFNTPPVASCNNVTVSAEANCAASASVNNGSYDPDIGDTITLSQSPASPYPLGETLVTLTVTDSFGVSSQCTAMVTVVPPTVLLAIDEDCIDSSSPGYYPPPNTGKGVNGRAFSAKQVNDDLARLGRRTPLRFFNDPANFGRQIVIRSGQVGDEGLFALKSIPNSWNLAGPTPDGIRNYLGRPCEAFPHGVGPGLGVGDDPEARLDKIPEVTPLRATGLKNLICKTVCAVVYDGDIGMNYGPLNGSLKGETLGVVAFRVMEVKKASGFSSGTLPLLTIEIVDPCAAFAQVPSLFLEAPRPRRPPPHSMSHRDTPGPRMQQ